MISRKSFKCTTSQTAGDSFECKDLFPAKNEGIGQSSELQQNAWIKIQFEQQYNLSQISIKTAELHGDIVLNFSENSTRVETISNPSGWNYFTFPTPEMAYYLNVSTSTDFKFKVLEFRFYGCLGMFLPFLCICSSFI